MKKRYKRRVYATHGNPAEVLRIETTAMAEAGRGEVVVEMRAAPINPADLNAIEGKYPVRRGSGDAGF